MDPSADLAAALRPVRMPIPTEAEALADGLLAFGLGLAAALLIYGLLRLAFGLRRSPRAALRAELAASRRLDAPERLLAQARLAERWPSAAGVRAELAAALYRPDSLVDLDATDRMLARALDRRGR
jgi:hypothetical protein